MAEEKHHHHLFHHKKEEEGPVDYEKEVKHHSHLEKIGELGAVAAGAFALVTYILVSLIMVKNNYKLSQFFEFQT